MKRTKPNLVEVWVALSLLWTCLLASCGPSVKDIPKPPSQEKSTTKAEHKEEDANKKINRLEGELKQAYLDRDTARDEKIQERVAWVRLVILWLTGLCAIGAILLAGAAIYFRSKVAAGLALSLLGMIVIAQATNLLLDHIKIAVGIGAAVMAGVGGYFLLTGHHLREALKKVVQVAENLKPDEETDEVALARKAMQKKVTEGYSSTIDKIRHELGHITGG